GIDALGRDVAEYRVQRAPDGGAFEVAVCFERDDGPFRNARHDLAEFFIQLGRKTTGFLGTQRYCSTRESPAGVVAIYGNRTVKSRPGWSPETPLRRGWSPGRARHCAPETARNARQRLCASARRDSWNGLRRAARGLSGHTSPGPRSI